MKYYLYVFILIMVIGISKVGYTQSDNTFQYDNQNRITQVTFSNGTVYEYTYDKLGNRTVKEITASTQAVPDLVIQSQSISQTTMAAGSAYTANCNEVNNGSGNAGGNYVKCYLSSNTTYEAGNDTEIGSVYNSSVNSFANIPNNITLTIPQATSAGSWYVLFFADAAGTINETSETNNIAYLQVTVITCSAMQANISKTDASCGNANGTATVSASSGNQPYTYLWSNGQTTQNATGLAGGNYTVTVTDLYGCSKVSSITVNSIGTPTLSISSGQASCGTNNGSATVTPIGGTAPYSYSWSNGQTNATISNLAAGNYSVTVTDANTCSAAESVSITTTANLLATINATNPSCGSGNGSLSSTITGGTQPFTFTWSNGATTQNISSLSAGDYSLTVTDVNNCTYTTSVTLSSVSTISASFTTQNATCNLANGTATATGSNGTAPYTYLWSNGQTTQTATNLAQGSYNVTVTDANNCSYNAYTTIGATLPPILSIATTNTECSGNTGNATATPSNGISPYTYTWSNGQTTQTATGLGVGSYTVSVTDNSGCTTSSTATISYQSSPSVQVIDYNTYSVFTTGLNVPNNICIDTLGNFYVANHSYGSYSGTYSNTVAKIDGAGNKSVFVSGYTWPSAIAIDKQQNLYFTQNNASSNIIKVTPAGTASVFASLAHTPGRITLFDDGNSTKFKIFTSSDWGIKGIIKTFSNGSSLTYDNDQYGDIEMTSDGQYMYAVKGNNLMRFNLTDSTNENWVTSLKNYSSWAGTTGPDNKYYFIASSISDTTKKAVFRLNGYNDFTEIVNDMPVSGELNDLVFKESSAGTYDLYVLEVVNAARTDPNSNRIIKFSNALSLSLAENITVDLGNDTSICSNASLTLDAGVGYSTYQWSDYETTQSIQVSNLSAGTHQYIITVTACGNSARDTVNIMVNPLPSSPGAISGLVNACPNLNSITYSVPSIANATSYVWTLPYGVTGTSSTNSITVNYTSSASSGNISVYGQNTCGAGAVSTIYVSVNNISPNLGSDISSCNGSSVTLSATGGTSYSWSPATGLNSATISNPVASPSTTTTYTVTVSNAIGCTASEEITVNVIDNPIMNTVPVTQVCQNDSIILVAGSGSDVVISVNNMDSTQISDLLASQQFDSTMFIPDGSNCATICFNTSVIFDSFNENAIISNASDIQSICVNIEHSYVGDLGFTMYCPNGQNVVLDPNSHSSGAYLGVPMGGASHDAYDNTSYPCDPAYNAPGTGWTYCWSEIFPQQGTMDALSSGTSPIDSTNQITHTNYLTTENPLSGLIGCPLNGTWNLQICDDYAIDNGYVFNWTLNLNPDLLPSLVSGNTIDSIVWSGSDILSVTDSSALVIHNSSGIFTYTATIFDEDCAFDTTVTLNVISAPAVNLGNDIIIYPDQNVTLDAGSGFASYLWSDGSTAQTLNIDSSGIGIGTAVIWVEVSDNVCYGRDTVFVTFSPSVNTESVISNNENFNLYPNPTRGKMTLEYSCFERGSVNVKIQDALGRIVFEKNINVTTGKNIVEFDVSNLSQGAYNFSIESDMGISKKMFVVNK